MDKVGPPVFSKEEGMSIGPIKCPNCCRQEDFITHDISVQTYSTYEHNDYIPAVMITSGICPHCGKTYNFIFDIKLGLEMKIQEKAE